MNTNVKLIQSALGLAIGLWMIACGGPSYGVINSEKPGTKVPVSKKPVVKTPAKLNVAGVNPSDRFRSAKSECSAEHSLFALDENLKKVGRFEWPIESYK